jgi:hypothetical protein
MDDDAPGAGGRARPWVGGMGPGRRGAQRAFNNVSSPLHMRRSELWFAVRLPRVVKILV